MQDIVAAGLISGGAEVVYWPHPIRRPHADVIHLHWAEAASMGRLARRSLPIAWLVMRRLEAAVRRHRRRGGRLIWTAHNILPPRSRHQCAGPDDRQRAGADLLAGGRRHLHVPRHRARNSRASIPALAARAHVVRHPSYATHFARLPTRPDDFWRKELGIDPSCQMMVLGGLVRRYKRIVETIRTFVDCALPDTVLVIAGPCYDPVYEAEVSEAAARSDCVIFRPGRLDDPDFHALLREGSYILVPQEKAQNSGTLIAALSAGTPAIAAATPANREIAALVSAGWITLVDTFDAASLRRAVLAADGTTGRPDLSAFDPAFVADRHKEIYDGR